METSTKQMTMDDYLEMDSNIAFKLAIFNRFSSIGDSCYSEICGGFTEGVYQWASHNIYGIIESANKKYTGWTISFENGAIRRVYIENWVMDISPKDWKHAKCLFNKYLKSDEKYNNSYEAQGSGYGY
jgi:hypothetical protein